MVGTNSERVASVCLLRAVLSEVVHRFGVLLVCCSYLGFLKLWGCKVLGFYTVRRELAGAM